MHELSIALSLVDLACDELSRLGATRVAAIHLRVGALSGIAADALRFSFDAASEGTALQGACLRIEEVPATAWCEGCSAERRLERAALRRCPVCGRTTPDLVRGEELELVALEVVDA